MKDHVISGIVIKSQKERFDIVIKTSKTLVTQLFIDDLINTFKKEFGKSTIKLLE